MSIGNFLLWVNKKIHWAKMGFFLSEEPALCIYSAPGRGSWNGDKMVIFSFWKDGKGSNQEV